MTAHTAYPDSRWTMPYIELTVHKAIDVKMHMAFEGREHLVVVGDPGTGKSFAVANVMERLERECVEDIIQGRTPIMTYDAMRTTASKATLVNLYNKVSGSDQLRVGLLRAWTPNEYCTQIVRYLIANGTRLICLDEAQNLQSHEIEQLRQVADRAQSEGHPLGLVLVGTPSLRNSLAETGQVGQRFSAFIEMPALMADEVEQVLPSLHAGLPSLENRLPRREWRALVRELWQASNGKWRRLFRIISNADEYAHQRAEPLDVRHLQTAIVGLEAER